LPEKVRGGTLPQRPPRKFFTILKHFKIMTRQTQIQTILEYLQNTVATASMVADATGVPQKNICRYKRDLEQAGKLVEVKKGVCKLTGFRAWYITTDPAQFPQPSQLSLFE